MAKRKAKLPPLPKLAEVDLLAKEFTEGVYLMTSSDQEMELRYRNYLVKKFTGGKWVNERIKHWVFVPLYPVHLSPAFNHNESEPRIWPQIPQHIKRMLTCNLMVYLRPLERSTNAAFTESFLAVEVLEENPEEV